MALSDTPFEHSPSAPLHCTAPALQPPPPACLQIHSRKMSVSPDVNFEELARSTDDFNAAQLKAVSSLWGGWDGLGVWV